MTTPSRGPFDVWAPRPQRVRLLCGDNVGGSVVEMTRDDDGWWTPAERCRCVDARVDVDYGYLLDDDPDPRPDPRSRRQPGGVHELSRRDRDDVRVGRRRLDRPPAGRVGDLRAARRHLHARTATSTPRSSRLDHLVDLGVDLVELMPVNAFNGTHNWGYDGVGWFAVHEQYGGPDAYRRFVDACHAARPRRGAGRGPQPPRPVGQLPPAVRPLPQGRPQHLGRPGQPRRRGLGRGAPLHPRQRADVVRGLPRRRPAARRRARPAATPPRSTSSRRWRSRPPRCRPTCAARSP